MDASQPTAESTPDDTAPGADAPDADAPVSAEADAQDAADDTRSADAGDEFGASDANGTSNAEGASDAGDASDGNGASDAGDATDAAADGEGVAEGKRPRKPRRERPKRDPHETPFGAFFLDELQRLAGLRGQFAYGVPEKLWRANREQTIRILREEVPMPTFKNQIQCILNADPLLLAQDVHYEMLVSVTPPEDSFRWLWLYMMLR